MKLQSPNRQINLTFQKANKSYDKECIEIDNREFPSRSGVYIVKYRHYTFRRLKGESDILKIGQTTNFKNRFDSYNMKRAATSFQQLSDLRNTVTKSWTDWHFMWLTANEAKKRDLIVELYFSTTPDQLEKKFILFVLDAHLELPPLNLTLGKW